MFPLVQEVLIFTKKHTKVTAQNKVACFFMAHGVVYITHCLCIVTTWIFSVLLCLVCISP